MKKLMITMAAIAMVGAANAATISLGLSLTDETESPHSAYTAYVMEDGSYDSFSNYLENNNVNGAMSVLNDCYVSFSTTDGTINETMNLDADLFIWRWYDNERTNGKGSQVFDILVINNTETEWAYAQYSADVFCQNRNYFGGGYAEQFETWSPIPVPEPTSGLMMLLGMAGLALKRRRA